MSVGIWWKRNVALPGIAWKEGMLWSYVPGPELPSHLRPFLPFAEVDSVISRASMR